MRKERQKRQDIEINLESLRRSEALNTGRISPTEYRQWVANSLWRKYRMEIDRNPSLSSLEKASAGPSLAELRVEDLQHNWITQEEYGVLLREDSGRSIQRMLSSD